MDDRELDEKTMRVSTPEEAKRAQIAQYIEEARAEARKEVGDAVEAILDLASKFVEFYHALNPGLVMPVAFGQIARTFENRLAELNRLAPPNAPTPEAK